MKTKPLLLSALFLVSAATAADHFDIVRNLDIFASLFKEVNAYYVDAIQPKELIEKGIKGMLAHTDPYTSYISEENEDSFSIQTTGRYAGVGALVGGSDKKTVIVSLYAGFPAYEAGIRVGDELATIDGKNIDPQHADASVMLRGLANTRVTVQVKRPGQKELLTFHIMRRNITIPNISYQTLLDNNVAYIKLDDFMPGAGKELKNSLQYLKGLGANSLILDLRENPGGSLYEAINVANVFLPQSKKITSTKGKTKEWSKDYFTLDAPADVKMPIVVLTAKSTASASEIVAGALQDYDRALLLGQRTFGKGLVQTTRQLPYHAQLKITSARYYIPSGRCIQAMRYTQDGKPTYTPDSLRKTFKTTAGRQVRDGGGIEPDVVTEEKKVSPLSKHLLASGEIFSYAAFYCAQHAKPSSQKNFSLSDDDYNKFAQTLSKKKWSFVSSFEKEADRLMASLKEQVGYESMSPLLNDLKNSIRQNQNRELMQHKDEIKPLLEEEIAFHYDLIKGRVEQELSRDQELKEAAKLLADASRYQQLLRPR
ncbi:MAG: peptidase S41 [Candidatus Nephrothrix sp. EaCA]|nr:MAG: peptidase S41 [Candidatus Nephrothrix sp. EaCA]